MLNFEKKPCIFASEYNTSVKIKRHLVGLKLNIIMMKLLIKNGKNKKTYVDVKIRFHGSVPKHFLSFRILPDQDQKITQKKCLPKKWTLFKSKKK